VLIVKVTKTRDEKFHGSLASHRAVFKQYGDSIKDWIAPAAAETDDGVAIQLQALAADRADKPAQVILSQRLSAHGFILDRFCGGARYHG
jgi:hypothetical protein